METGCSSNIPTDPTVTAFSRAAKAPTSTEAPMRRNCASDPYTCHSEKRSDDESAFVRPSTLNIPPFAFAIARARREQRFDIKTQI